MEPATNRLTYFSGSPFARMCRVAVIEWSLPVVPEEHSFPPGPEMFAINPLGQVPALIRAEQATLFPTFLILEELWRMAGEPGDAYRPEAERQLLLVALQMGDAYVAACYHKWHGLGPTNRSAFDFDPRQRNLDRVGATLDWFDRAAESGELRGGLTLPGLALACLMQWADMREGLDWRSRPAVKRIVEGLLPRPSFLATMPRVWSYDE